MLLLLPAADDASARSLQRQRIGLMLCVHDIPPLRREEAEEEKKR
jgi:hypothetical protein